MERLIGREAELGEMTALLGDARDRHGRAVLVSGEPGIGKTRLIQELSARAVADGLSVAIGRSSESEAPPFWPWRRLLRSLGVDETVLGARRTGSRPAQFASVVRQLDDITSGRAALLVVEDLHWADGASLALTRFVVDVVSDLPLLVVLTCREEPLDVGPEVAAFLRALPPTVVRLALTGLDLPATAALVAEATEQECPLELAEQIRARTGGNPFYMREVVRLRRAQHEPSAWVVPDSVRHVLAHRLARLPQAVHQMLGAAAVLGAEPATDDIIELTGQAPHEVAARLDEAVGARLVLRTSHGCSFAHDLVREALLEGMDSKVRMDLHQRAAVALERRIAASPERGLAGRAAAHWLEVSGDEARRRMGELALAAASEARRELAYELATRYLEWARDSGAGDPVALLIELGEAQVRAGQLRSGRQTLRDAAIRADEANRSDDMARAVLAIGGGIGGFEVEIEDEEQRGLLRRALGSLPEDSPRRPAVMARLSLSSALTETEAWRADLAAAAATMARRADEPSSEVAALAAYCDARSGPDHVQERLEASARMQLLAEQADDAPLLLLVRRLRLVALFESGRFSDADKVVSAYARTAERLMLPLYSWPVPVWRGMRALMEGDVDSAWRWVGEADALGRRADSANARVMVLTLRMAIHRSSGRPEEAFNEFEPFMQEFMDYPSAVCQGASLLAAAGLQDQARRLFSRAAAAGIDAIPRDAEWIEAVWHLGDAALALGERETVEAAHDALHDYADLWAIDGIGGACFGVVSHILGRLAAGLERPDEARDLLGVALERHRSVGAHLLTAQTERALVELGRPRSTARPPRHGELHREGSVWRLVWQGHPATVSDSKGMHDLATLLAHPDREFASVDLVEPAAPLEARRSSSDLGPVLDGPARAAYRRRLVDLEEELEQAVSHADTGTATRLREERDFLARELATAVGLGGKPRRSGDPAERARKAVTMRIATALRGIGEVHPALARHLRGAVTTGRFCVYRPDDPVVWHVVTVASSRRS